MVEQNESYMKITSKEFPKRLGKSQQMVVLNCSSDKSSVCQLFDPEFEAVSKEYEGRVMFARLNLDDVKQDDVVVNAWNIDGIPTVIFFKQGLELNRIKGIMMREKLRKRIEGVLLAHF